LISSTEVAQVLSQALPYIQRFRGQTFVVKYGGSAMGDPERISNVVRNVLLLQIVGIRVVLVHGGGPEIDTLAARLGLEKRTIDGLRVTDDATMEAVEMALLKANQNLVSELLRQGGAAVGLSGRDGGLLRGLPVSEQLGRAGVVERVNTDALETVIQGGSVPVVCTIAADSNFQPLNINADLAASSIAQALSARKLILLTDTNGVLSDPEDSKSTISELSVSNARRLMESGRATRGMIPKLDSAITALEAGVESVHLINGSTPNALLIEIFTDSGIGTMMRA
jgi:acetylglutamate kinase